MALTSWNDILNKPKAVADVEELALTVEQLSASVLSISEDVGELALDVSQLSASVLSIAGDVSEIDGKLDKVITKKVVSGDMFAMALFNGAISVTIQVDGDFSADYNTVTLSKTQNINVGIYGDIGAIAATVDLSTVNYSGNVITIKFTPSVTLSTYTTAGRGFCLHFEDPIIATLSKTP